MSCRAIALRCSAGSPLSSDPCQRSPSFSRTSDGLTARMVSLPIQGSLHSSFHRKLFSVGVSALARSRHHQWLHSKFLRRFEATAALRPVFQLPLSLSAEWAVTRLARSAGALSGLERMHLDRNALLSRAGPFPPGSETATDCLQFLDLSDNRFSGSVPSSVTQLKNYYEFFVAPTT